LGYRPNATARALANRRTNAIGIVGNFIGDEPNLYFLEVLSGVINGAAEAGQTTVVFALASWDDAPTRIPALCDGRVDGLILVGPRLQDDGAAWLPPHTPVVAVQSNSPVSGAMNVESDDEAGAYAMVRHLLDLGHRRILHVAGPQTFTGVSLRLDGYLRAHATAGVPPAPGHVVRSPLTVAGGREAMAAWLGSHRGEPLPDAVFGCNDAVAFGCIETLRARGLRVPEDVSVVGYDCTLMARWMQMATVRQPLDELGREAARALVLRIDAMRSGEAFGGPMELVLPTEIVQGVTLATPRATALTIA
jgi:DNA-binding LacI/PurR family transcriptional regulator